MYLPNYGCYTKALSFLDVIDLIFEDKLTDSEVLACVHDFLDFSENYEDIHGHILDVLELSTFSEKQKQEFIAILIKYLEEKNFSAVQNEVRNLIEKILEDEMFSQVA